MTTFRSLFAVMVWKLAAPSQSAMDEAIVEELNKAGSATLRDRILSAVNDAVEECFEQTGD